MSCVNIKVCLNCGNEFNRPGNYSNKEWGKRKFCSVKCSSEGKRYPKHPKRPSGLKYNIKAVNRAWFKKGSSGFKGKHTEESKEKMRVAHLGQVPWCKGKRSPHATGERHWNWKEGITAKGKIERNVFRKRSQKLIFERDDYTCQVCCKRGGNLQVDHIKSWKDYPDLRFDINNCRTLCAKCHYFVTFKRPMPDKVKAWGHNFKLLERRALS